MTGFIPIYATFSVAAMIAKLIIVWFGRNQLRSFNNWFLAFFFSLFGINLLELVGFFYPADGSLAMPLMTIFYECGLIVGFSFMATTLATTECLRPSLENCLLAALFGGTTVLFWPGAVIADVVSIGYTSTRVEGPLYWVFQVMLLGSLSSGVSLLAYHSKFGNSSSIKRKAKALLLSMIPIFLVVVVIVVLMEIGIKVTASVFISCAILLFLIISMKSKDEHQLFSFLSHVPITSEYRLVNSVRDAVCKLDSLGLQQALSRFEAALIQNALSRTDGNKTSAAELLGISRTTLRRKLDSD